MTEFRFNDELLLQAADRELAQQQFPSVFFALDHPSLRADFKRIDAGANRAKSKSRMIGVLTLIFAVVSLLAFPLEPLIISTNADTEISRNLFRLIAIIGAICGVLAVLFGNLGLWFGKLKRNWLQHRLMTERLRQWHAQYLIAHALDISAAVTSDTAREAFLDARTVSYNRFKRSVLEQVSSEYTKFTVSGAAAYSGLSVSEEGPGSSFWIEPGWADLAGRDLSEADHSALDALLSAYDGTRFIGQVQYTNYILSSEGKFWSLPAKQASVLRSTAFGLVIFAFVANFIALLSAIWPSFPISQSILGSVAISFAILAVGVRAFQEGLRPERELRRMQFYASAVSAARNNFLEAKSAQEKIIAMSILERASFEEMVEFLSTNERARFVL
ncbi:MAG: hypothetical protein AAFR51_06370 [Pseudomonadota bacterium]